MAKLAGAPDDKAAGVDLHVSVGVGPTAVDRSAYAFDYAASNRNIIMVGE